MLGSEILDKWYTSAKKLAFRYYDGFFQFPLISNSPETIIKSMSRMPFVKHDVEAELFSTQTPFVNAKVLYQEVEEGLWLFHSSADYKENVNYTRANNKNLSADYYTMYLEINRNAFKNKNALLNGEPYANSCWVLTKPMDTSSYCKYAGCSTKTVVIHFTQNWINNYLGKNQNFAQGFQHFFSSKAQFVILPDDLKQSQNVEIVTKKMFNKKSKGNLSVKEYEKLALKIIRSFLTRLMKEHQHPGFYDLRHGDRLKLAKVERKLTEELLLPFPGIEILSQEGGISPTKLKQKFKLIYGDSIFQYFRKMQMKQAKEILVKNKSLKVQDLSRMFGYQNMTKFSNAFKTVHGVFPSDLLK